MLNPAARSTSFQTSSDPTPLRQHILTKGTESLQTGTSCLL